MNRIFLFVFIVVNILIVTGCDGERQETIDPDRSITILWAKMKVTDALQELVNDFTRETGIQVNVVQEPWPTFQTACHSAAPGHCPRCEKHDAIVL